MHVSSLTRRPVFRGTRSRDRLERSGPVGQEETGDLPAWTLSSQTEFLPGPASVASTPSWVHGDQRGLDMGCLWDGVALATATSASDMEPGRRIELLTYALRERLHACLVCSGDDRRRLTRPYDFHRRIVPVHGVHVYGMNMGWRVGLPPPSRSSHQGCRRQRRLPDYAET